MPSGLYTAASCNLFRTAIRSPLASQFLTTSRRCMSRWISPSILARASEKRSCVTPSIFDCYLNERRLGENSEFPTSRQSTVRRTTGSILNSHTLKSLSLFLTQQQQRKCVAHSSSAGFPMLRVHSSVRSDAAHNSNCIAILRDLISTPN